MAKTALDLTETERKSYKLLDILERRRQTRIPQVEERWSQARLLANQAAKILYEKFGADRVLLFGSAAQRTWFTRWSDVDLAAWGIKPERFYAAVAAMTDMGANIKIDLVDPNDCSPEFQFGIEEYGVEL